MVECISKSDVFYSTGLKTSKRDFGNAFTAANMKTKIFFDKPQVKHNDRISLKDQIWLKSVGSQSVRKSLEYLRKAVR